MFENGLFDSCIAACGPGAVANALDSRGVNIDTKISESLISLIRSLLKEVLKFSRNEFPNDLFEASLKSGKLSGKRRSATRGMLRWNGYSVVPVPFRFAGSLCVSKESMAVFVLSRASSPVPSSVEVGQKLDPGTPTPRCVRHPFSPIDVF